MKWSNGYRMKLMLVGFVAAFMLGSVSAKADFTFGEPTNLGPTVNTSYGECASSISTDGLSLYFCGVPFNFSPEGYGGQDLWITTRATIEDDWTSAVNLGPTLNTSSHDGTPSISSDGLTLYFSSERPGGSGSSDLWKTTRQTTSDPWGTPINLGSTVNSSYCEAFPSISSDSLELYFSEWQVTRPGGYGGEDIWVTTRPTVSDPWGTPVNLGPTLNTSSHDSTPSISADGLSLYFESTRPGGLGGEDIWVTRRATVSDPWAPPVNLGPHINSSAHDCFPNFSADGSTLYFSSRRPGGFGGYDLWQVSINPVVDLNGDGKVDSADMHIMVDHWGENYPLCDIGPTPLGDGIVDIQDMIVLAEHLYRLAAHWKLDETDGNIAYDSFGDYDGTLNGNPLWQPTGGMKGGALLFDGADDYVETPFILNPSKGSLSVFAWVYCWTPGQVIISLSNTAGARGVIPGSTWLGIDPTEGTLMTGFSDQYFGTLESESVITDVQWHHVGFVYDMDSLHRRLYVDGVLVAEDATVVSGVPSDGGLYIGASKDLDAGTLFSGFIDDVRIYNQALTTEGIAVLAQ